MRLLNTKTIQLSTFYDKVPSYAILSHTWGEDEIVFEDVSTKPAGPLNTGKTNGDAKVTNACRQASRDGFDYIWIDTCCIDKSSSTELSEAINSMFKWYESSDVCYAHLADILSRDINCDKDCIEGLEKSRWFTRGWTLQELIAPQIVKFYDMEWAFLGNQADLTSVISEITGISEDFLRREVSVHARELLNQTSIAARMCWIADRQTTRDEDLAYCMMGLFRVNMPLLYGEGMMRAFGRLQEEILKISDDQSILAFVGSQSVLSWSPRHDKFARGIAITPESKTGGDKPMILTRAGLQIQVSIVQVTFRSYHGMLSLVPSVNTSCWLGILNCHHEDDYLSRPSILLVEMTSTAGTNQKPEMEMDDGRSTMRSCRRAGSLLWLDHALVDANGNARSVRWEDGIATHRVDISIGEVEKDVTVLLKLGPENYEYESDNITIPPLKIRLAGVHSQSYPCLASYPPLKGKDHDHIPPFALYHRHSPFFSSRSSLYAKSMPYGRDEDEIGRPQPLGAIYFTCTTPGKRGFFIVWGFTTRKRPLGHSGSLNTTGASWWDDVEMECCVRGWRDILAASDRTAEALFDGKQAIEWIRSRTTTSKSESKFELDGIMPGESWDNDKTKHGGTVVGSHRVRARIKPVDFLGRRSFELTVEVSDI